MPKESKEKNTAENSLWSSLVDAGLFPVAVGAVFGLLIISYLVFLKSENDKKEEIPMNQSVLGKEEEVKLPPAIKESFNYKGTTYYPVRSDDPTGNSGSKVCARVQKQCVGYTAFTLEVCKGFHPTAREKSDTNGMKAGFFCEGLPQGGMCALERVTCHICPTCRVSLKCEDPIEDLYRETYVECK